VAVEDMLAHTDHPAAPWHVIAAESKAYTRVRVLELVIAAVEHALRATGREPVEIEASL
jgi:polyphosphate kinase 2 (PPK2 family)